MTEPTESPAGTDASSDPMVSVVLPAGRIGYREAGPADGSPVVFLHGWPQSSASWRAVLDLAAADGFHALAPDLPGIGASRECRTDGSTDALADVVADLVDELDLSGVTLVGQDIGGMTAFAMLRRSDRLARVAILNTVVPGVPPWEKVLANPYVWHFAFHSIPDLPELLVSGHERAYFDFFFDALSPRDSRMSDGARDVYTAAYLSPESLAAGFDWYRQLPADAQANAGHDDPVATPVLYLRGQHEGGDLDEYLAGLRGAGLTDVRGDLIPGAGHYSADDSPQQLWRLVGRFAAH